MGESSNTWYASSIDEALVDSRGQNWSRCNCRPRRSQMDKPKVVEQGPAWSTSLFWYFIAERAAKPNLVVVAECLEEGGLDGLGGRSVHAACVAYQDQHLLGCLGSCRSLLHLTYPIHICSAPAEARPEGRESEERFGFHVGAQAARTRPTSGGGATRQKTQGPRRTRWAKYEGSMVRGGPGRVGDGGAWEGRRVERGWDAEEGGRECRFGSRHGHRGC